MAATTLDELKEKLMNQSKGSIVSILGSDKTEEWLSSPARDLNRILSGSLYSSVQVGNHIAIIGPEAVGKSSFMALMLADAQKKGYIPVVIDAEGAWKPPFVTRWGLNPDNMIRIKSLWIEDIMVELTKFIENGFTNLAIAFDSIGALESKKMIRDGTKKDDVKSDQGRLQKDIKRMLKMLVSIAKFNSSIVFSAGHYYGNPTGYGDPEKIGGGFYYRLSADTMITLKKSPIYEFPNAEKKAEKGKILGTSITAATLKNRLYPPFQEASVEIDFQKGVNENAGLVKVAMDIGLLEKNGSWYKCDTLELKIQGEANFYNKLNSMDITPLLDKIEEFLKTTGYSSVNRKLELQEEEKEEIKEEEIKEEEKEEVKSNNSKNLNSKKSTIAKMTSTKKSKT